MGPRGGGTALISNEGSRVGPNVDSTTGEGRHMTHVGVLDHHFNPTPDQIIAEARAAEEAGADPASATTRGP